MSKTIKTAYEQVLNNSSIPSSTKKIRSLSQAYSLITEKTAFYSKDYPDNTPDSPNIPGFRNLGFVQSPNEIINAINGISLRDDLEILFKEGGWNLSKYTQLKDFEISFLTPISQKMAKHKFSKSDLQSLINQKSQLSSLEQAIIESKAPFDLLTTIKADVSKITDELIEFCYYRSGKTSNDVTFGDGEVLITLFTNGKKGTDEGDLVFPKAKKVEIKASEGRIDKPAKDAFYKTNIRNFLVRINKQLTSTSKQKVDLEIKNKQKELSAFLDSPSYKQVFNAEQFDEKILSVIVDFDSKTFEEFKNLFFKYKLPKQTSSSEKSVQYVANQFLELGYLNPTFQIDNSTQQELFRNAYNQLKALIDGFKIGTTRAATDVFEKSGGTFIKNFFLQDFGLSLDETAEAFSLCCQNSLNTNEIKKNILHFLNKDDNFTKLKTGEEAVLQAIIFSIQLISYSKNNFDYILFINKNTHSCISFHCPQESPSLFMDLANKYLQLKNNNKIDLAIQIDSRGGSQVSLLC
jgi:hypothetical protein